MGKITFFGKAKPNIGFLWEGKKSLHTDYFPDKPLTPKNNKYRKVKKWTFLIPKHTLLICEEKYALCKCKRSYTHLMALKDEAQGCCDCIKEEPYLVIEKSKEGNK